MCLKVCARVLRFFIILKASNVENKSNFEGQKLFNGSMAVAKSVTAECLSESFRELLAKFK